jgi:hypothetical protein
MRTGRRADHRYHDLVLARVSPGDFNLSPFENALPPACAGWFGDGWSLCMSARPKMGVESAAVAGLTNVVDRFRANPARAQPAEVAKNGLIVEIRAAMVRPVGLLKPIL